MKSPAGWGSCWPSPQQETLLGLAFERGSEGANPLAALRSCGTLEELDSGSVRLLPLVYRALERRGVRGAPMEKLRGVYRYFWYKNQVLLHRAGKLLKLFERAQVETLMLKGVALTQLYYRDMGVRPMGDFDLMVRREQASAALRLLAEQGWHPLRWPDTAPDRFLPVFHAHGFADAQTPPLECDLHWYALWECCVPDVDEAFWSGAVPMRVDDATTQALNATDQLLQICVHGARWQSPPAIRWVADALVILEQAGDAIDWERLLAQTAKRRVSLEMRDTLRYLQTRWQAPVPDAVMRRLERLPVSWQNDLFYRLKMRPTLPVVGDFLVDYFRYLRLNEERSWLGQIEQYPGYLQRSWALDHPWEVGIRAAGRLAEEIRALALPGAAGRQAAERGNLQDRL